MWRFLRVGDPYFHDSPSVEIGAINNPFCAGAERHLGPDDTNR
jgi:hypothetical protein